jgi:hypothetical protein
MITLVLAMVWTRRGQAMTLALLSMFAVAAAVAAPAYLRAADRAVAAGQVATALPAERGLEISAMEDLRSGAAVGGDGGAPISGTFADIAGSMADIPGVDYVYAAEFPAIGLEKDVHYRSRFVYRQDACAHLALVSGRCPLAEGDVLIGEQTAKRLDLSAGQPITLTYARFNPDPRTPIFMPDGMPKSLTVVGIYQVPDPTSAFWGMHGYWSPDPGDRPGEPVFTDTGTLSAMDHGATDMSMDGNAGPAALAVDRLSALRAGLDRTRRTAVVVGSGLRVDSSIPDLLNRIDDGRAAAHLIVPVLAVPLVLLACLSIFLAVGYGTEDRRPELAVVALRGARWGQRWWLATGENLIAIVAGAVIGCLVGQLLVNLVAAVRFAAVGPDAGLASLRYVPFALVAAVLAALFAERGQLLSPVAELLRRAPGVPSGARAVAVEAGVALLAILAGVQLTVTGGDLSGVGTFAAALIMLALALLAARAVLPVVTRLARRGVRRRRLGAALAGFQLSRRPGAARLFALLVAAVAVVIYASAAVDVAARGREIQARVGTGADRVLTVAPLTRGELLAGVRAADPQGRYAMAAVRLPHGADTAPISLAVDTTRLAAVAYWADGTPGAARIAAALRPPAPAPVTIAGQDLTVDLTASGLDPGRPIRLTVTLSSAAGLGDVAVQLATLDNGPHTYSQRVPLCRKGCRLNAIGFVTTPGITQVTGRVTVRGIGIINPDTAAVTPAQLADVSRWRGVGGAQLTAAADGLRIGLDAPLGLPGGAFVQPVDTPYPLPVADAGESFATTVNGFDGKPVPIQRVVHLPAVPAAGTHATLFDLEYADRLSVDAAPVDGAQVWLAPDAPADVVDRLAAHGLAITGDRRAGQVRHQLDEQGPALALWFYLLAALLAVALAAGALILAATVDRSRRVEDLTALRTQGLNRRALRQATLWTYPVLVAIAVIAGLVIGWLGWRLTGWTLPLAGLHPPSLPLPGLPRPPILVAAAVLVFVVLAVVAWVAGRRTLKEIS